MILRKTPVALAISLTFICIAPAQAPAQTVAQPPAPSPGNLVMVGPPSGTVTQFPDKPDPSVRVPQFDVISIKPHTDSPPSGNGMMRAVRIGMQMTADGFRGENLSAHMLLTSGFGINDDQALNEPGWMKDQRYDVEAKVAGPDVAMLAKLTRAQRNAMDLQVLTDRFKLTYHREDRDLPVYNLVVGKGGPKLTESKPDPSSRGPMSQMRVSSGRMQMNMKSATMDNLAKMLTNQTGRTVVDKTGLTGHYDIAIDFASQGVMGLPGGIGPAPGPDADTDSSSASIFTAIQDLGLKLESAKGPASVVIIDHIEKPAEN